MPSKQRVMELVRQIEDWKLLEAFEEFYADDVVMQENQQPPTVGKAANREREKGFVSWVARVHESRVTEVLVDGDDVVIHWNAEYTTTDGQRVRADQLALQKWRGDRIVRERFVYDPTAAAAAA